MSQLPAKPAPKTVTFEEFGRLDLRTALVVAAEKVPDTAKLLKLTIRLDGTERSIVSGIAGNYTPEQMVGKTVIVVANLAPAKIRGIRSEGMLLACGEEQTLRLLTTDGPADPGIRVG